MDRNLRCLVAIALALVVSAGCGTRVRREAASSAGSASAAPTAAEAAPPPAAPLDAAGTTPAGAGGAPAPAGAAVPNSAGASPATARSASASPGTAGAQRTVPRPGTPAAPTADRARSVPTGPAAPSPNQPVPGKATGRTPITIATFGIQSGPLGGILTGVPALQAWVRWKNDTGGVNGHPIQLLVYDDGGDPAKARGQVQEAIERRGSVAFLHSTALLTGQGTQAYIVSKGVPVVGSETGSDWFYSSPLYFPQASSARFMYKSIPYGMASMILPAGKKKAASINCLEAQACKDAGEVFRAEGPRAGLEVVYTAQASLAQPGYTAECLQAQRAGAEAVVVALDPSGVDRFVNDCARQGYRPVYSLPSLILTNAVKGNPNLEGLAAPLTTFPFFQSGTPATDEFQRVMRKYAGGVVLTAGMAAAWTSAKLFEKATAQLGEPPTPQDILTGLTSIQNDDLGGLTQPLTFAAGANAKGTTCWFMSTLRKGQFVSPDNFQRHCLGD